MNKSMFIILTISIVAVVAVAGCVIPTEEVHIDFPFDVGDVEKVEAYHYDGVPAAAEKKVIDDAAGIEDVYALFERITLQNKDTEETTGNCVAIFRFVLSDGTNYDIVYTSSGVKDGILKSDAGKFQYFTSSDIGGYWNNLPYEVVPVEERELLN